MKTRFRSLISIVLCVLMVIAAFCAHSSVFAVVGDTITYKYLVNCSSAINAFDGEVRFPNTLSVNSVVVYSEESAAEYAVNNGKILFNATNVGTPFDFSNGEAMVTVEFTVNGEYNKNDIYTTLSEFYTTEVIYSGNIAYNYSNIVDDEVITSGHVDIDNPSESYTDPTDPPTEPTSAEQPTTSEVTEPASETTAPTTVEETTAQETTEEPTEPPVETTYSLIYYYNNGTEDTSLTRTFKTSQQMNAREIANAAYPSIRNPYYTYSIESARFTDDTTIDVELEPTQKLYDVRLNDDDYSQRPYLYVETINTDEETAFKIGDNVVAVGTEFKFFVTGDMDIYTDDTVTATDEFASLTFNALSVSEEKVIMELLATAKVENYARMGVAFGTTAFDEADVVEAATQVTSGTGRGTNGVVIHNSSVQLQNSSGQYQFIYAPYLSTSKVTPNLNLYFRAYVVKNNGDVIVSDAESVTPYNAMQ